MRQTYQMLLLHLMQFVSSENHQTLNEEQLARRARSGVASAGLPLGLDGPSEEACLGLRLFYSEVHNTGEDYEVFRGVIILFLTMWGFAADFQSLEAGIGTIRSEKDLVSVLTQIQKDFQGISPPSTDVFITKTDVPYKVDWSGFSKKTTKYMTAYMDEYGLLRYPLLLWEDASTRDKVISLASPGYELARIAPAKDYVPEAYYTSLLSKGVAYSEFTRWIFDPAHTAIEIELISAYRNELKPLCLKREMD